MMRSNAETSVEVPMHAAYDEVARQLGLPETPFEAGYRENILHYRYLAHEVYKLRNFLTLNFGNFEGPAVPHAIDLITMLNSAKQKPPEPEPEDREIVKARVKHYLKEYFSMPHLMDMFNCLDTLYQLFKVPPDRGSQYLVEAIHEGSVNQIGNIIYGRGKEPILEVAAQMGRSTKTRLVENLSDHFGVGTETLVEELERAIARGTAKFDVAYKGNEITVTPVSEKTRKVSKVRKRK